MWIPLINKKLLIILAGIIFAVGIILAGVFYQSRKNQRQEYIRQIESQKAQEITIRIIEGWSNREIGIYLEKEGITPLEEFLQSVKNYHTTEYDSFLPKEAVGNLQGFLYPDTYRLFKSITDRKVTSNNEAANIIIGKLLGTFGKRLPQNATSLAEKQGLNLYQVVILASIIENETGRNAATPESKAKLDQERKIVAGIFYNRLRSNVALQSDATINYITGKNDPAALLTDLEVNSPYNTYKNRGLPPTPIGNPSLSSIIAALEPSHTDYFYFLHKQPSGEPVYSKTFEEHVKNKQKYLK